MVAEHGRLEQALRSGGHRLTEPRQAVWTALASTGLAEPGPAGPEGGHLTVDEVVERTHAAGSGVDRATAYRVLALLEELGLVRATALGAGSAVHWERAHPDEHFHLRCTACGTVHHHVGTLVATVREHLDSGHGFAAESIELTVHGRCAACREGSAD
jgi:Fur family ferric uptake transcriptional regulator